MKIRDVMLKNLTDDLEDAYKMSKQEAGRIAQAITEAETPVECSDLHYERGYHEGKLQTIGVMLNFIQDYKAKPLELEDKMDPGAKIEVLQYDGILQLAYHHLAAYAFERMKEQQGEVIQGESLRCAVQVIQVLTKVLENLDPQNTYCFYDGRGGTWTGIYSFPKGAKQGAKEVHLKVDFEA